ncbi:class I SAM-dependent methyltransferase [Nocardia africana]|uniref:Methyltransferase domain n=1 Tax=Nocardia africana TaxID=134964 RepID=A0A378WUZ7_9NOCA|nr:class I SAM-dependent methyltransferase [Nocardia africana]MCC3313464.1 class I SAM-dependent methyltransferase [Nocardia africana]SUA45170.1 Methyltransferase domain [Nocardia africana]
MSVDAQAGNWMELNRANWDERVPIHARSDFYDLDGFVAGAEALRDFEPAEVGDVHGKRLLHLQCHIGTDTLAWARRGASVTGLDFSAPAVRTATGLAARIGVTGARFVTANVYDAVTALERDRYDIVYTGVGALIWLPDLVRWASVVAELLTPGGFVYLTEFHPFGDILAEDDGRTVAYDYFDPAPQVWDEPGTYADPDAPTTANVTVQWQHGIGDIVTAIAGAGLRLEFLHEHDFTLYPRFRTLAENGGRYRLPAGQPRVPLLFSLRASKPHDRITQAP